MHDLRLGDCRQVMRGLGENSVDSIVTDPPYGLGFMGKEWDTPGALVERKPDRSVKWDKVGGNHNPCNSADAVRTKLVEGRKFQSWCETWAAEAFRVLKPGGHLLSFGGSRTYHRMVCAIEDAGFEIRDGIMWVYGSGFPKSHNGPWGGTALKPAHEPIVVARKPLEGTVAQNVAKWGTGALNIDGCRVEGAWSTWRRKDGTINPGIGTSSPAPMDRDSGKGRAFAAQEHVAGRWPANLIHDGSDEVMDLFASFGEKTSGNRNGVKRPHHGIAAQNGVDKLTYREHDTGRVFSGDTGNAARFFYCAKASKADRDAGLEGMPKVVTMRYGEQGQGSTPQQTPRKPVAQRNTHPTVKPTALMRYLCRLVTPPGGTILDPFMGSGSTGRGALYEGFSFIGIETDPAYFAIAERRMAHAEHRAGLQLSLFSLVAAE